MRPAFAAAVIAWLLHGPRRLAGWSAGERRSLATAPDPRVVFLVFVQDDDRQVSDAVALRPRKPVPAVVMASV